MQLSGTDEYSFEEDGGAGTLFFLPVSVRRIFFGGEWAEHSSVDGLDAESMSITYKFSMEDELSAPSSIKGCLG